MGSYIHSANDRTPFTYVIHNTITNQSYYGVRYAKGCHPDQLWTTYFTSSKNVKNLINYYGVNSFIVEVRRIFDGADKALAWEQKVLRRLNAVKDSKWINKSDGVTFRHNQTLSEKTRKKMSDSRKGVAKPRTARHQENLNNALKGRVSPQKGKPLSESTKRKLSEKAKGRISPRKGLKNSEEHRLKISIANKGKGRQQSDTEKKLRSQSAKENNFGDTCKGLIWANDGVKSKRIRPEDFASSGFILGRLLTKSHTLEP